MRASLISRLDGSQYDVSSKQTKIGHDNCDINVQSPVVEKTHAIISYDDELKTYVISDLNTAHGTYVNERRVQNAAVRLSDGDVIRFGFSGPLFDIKVDSGMFYPPVPGRSMQAWNSSSNYAGYTQANREPAYLPYLPVSATRTEQSYLQSNGETQLPYPPPTAPGQVYIDPKVLSGENVMPHPPLRAKPTVAGPTQRMRPTSAGGLSSSGRWLSSKSIQDMDAEERAHDMEQKLLKMGDELSRLASFEAECYRKDSVIVSLRNEIADLRSLVSMKEDAEIRDERDGIFARETVYSQHDADMLKRLIREKEQLEKHSTHKLALLQNQISSKDREIMRLEERFSEMQSGKWPREGAEASTNAIASLKSTIAKKDLKIAQLQTDFEKSNKQRSQSASLINTLQRETSSKDSLIQKSRHENDKLRRDIREKESQISSLSAKLTKQRASKEVEYDFRQKEEEISSFKQRLSNADHQIKEKISVIRNLKADSDNLSRTIDDCKQNEIMMQKELQNMRIQYVEKERADKSNRVEIKELQIKNEKFRKRLLQSLFSSGVAKQNKELHDDDIIHLIQQLNDERISLRQTADQFSHFEEERKTFAREDEHGRQILEKVFTSLEKRLIRNGRLCETLDDEVHNIQAMDIPGSVEWIKNIILSILQQERSWEQAIEEALQDAGMEVDRGKKDPGHLIRKMNEKIKKKKDKISGLKMRLKAVESEHNESLTNFKKKFLRETEDEVSKAVAKLKRDEEKRVQDLTHDFLKREKQKVAEAVEAERKIFEREFGNLTDLHKQLGHTQLEIDQHKNKTMTFQDQILQLKFAMEKAQQNEKLLKKDIEERDINHKVQLECVNKEKEEAKRKFADELNVYREQAHQYSLTIVALEDRLLKINKSKRKSDEENIYMKQCKDSFLMSGRTSPRSPRKMVSRPTSPRKTHKRDASIVTELSLMEQDKKRQDELQKMEQLVQLLRKEAGNAKRESVEQSDVIIGLRRDLAGASARLSDMAGELDDTQKQKIEELQNRIRKQDEELFSQRKQLVELSNLVERHKTELLRRDDKLKEQIYVTKMQGQKLQEKGKEMVQLIKTQESEKEEKEHEDLVVEKQAFATREISAAGARCLGDKHGQTITRQREALVELRNKVKDLEQFRPPMPPQQTAMQQVGLMKRELNELRSELAVKEQDMLKDETELQSETRLAKELLNGVNQELAVEKMAHRETRESLDTSEQTYLDLLRAVCSLLDMELPKQKVKIAHLPQKERDKMTKERRYILDEVIKNLDALHKRLKRKEKLLGGYEKDLTQLRETEDLAGRKSAEAMSLSTAVRSKQDEIDCLREALNRVRDELDQQKRLNKSISQRKVFKMDVDKQMERESKGHSCFEDDEKLYKEEARKRKQAEKMKRKSYEIESLKKELRSADLELNETAAKLYELESSQRKASPRISTDAENEPALDELWQHT